MRYKTLSFYFPIYSSMNERGLERPSLTCDLGVSQHFVLGWFRLPLTLECSLTRTSRLLAHKYMCLCTSRVTDVNGGLNYKTIRHHADFTLIV